MTLAFRPRYGNGQADRKQVYVAQQMNYDHNSKLKPMREVEN
ncbi:MULTISPECIES: hypothetical protein [unclassified Moorena]|nr:MULTISPECIES: hypothetical protein [unclassified Moorena]